MRRRRYGAKIRPREHLLLRATKRYGRQAFWLILVSTILILMVVELRSFLKTSPAFKLSRVVVRTNGSLDEARVWKLIDEPQIFNVDLLRLSQQLEQLPEVKSSRAIRALPDSLIVEVEERLPLAQIRSDRYFPVDGDGVILPGVRNYPDPDLPLIVGVGLKADLVKVGKPYQSIRLDKALGLLQAISSSESLKGERVTRIDVREPGDISFWTNKNIEVRVGGEDFLSRVKLLDEVLKELQPRERDIKYIDLRFGDAAIGWK